MPIKYLWLVPVGASLSAISSFFIAYWIAWTKNHIPYWIAYISECGSHPPASCVFGILLNVSASLTAVNIYLCHLHIAALSNISDSSMKICRRNKRISMLGFIIVPAMLVAANFQFTNEPMIHNIAAIFIFVPGIIYCWGQVYLERAIKSPDRPRWLCRMQLVMCCVVTVSAISMFANLNWDFLVIAIDKNITFRYGLNNYIISALSEWILAIGFELIVLSFAYDLRKFHLLPAALIRADELRGVIKSPASIAHVNLTSTA